MVYLDSGAIISSDEKYRYRLWREWEISEPNKSKTCAFVMLNPSTADATQDDPTIRKCVSLVKRMEGYGRLEVLNLFAYRATNPRDMLLSGQEIIGWKNDDYIQNVTRSCSRVICAWGQYGSYLDRGEEVLKLLTGRLTYALKLSKSGFPCHPLYLPLSSPLIPYPEGK